MSTTMPTPQSVSSSYRAMLDTLERGETVEDFDQVHALAQALLEMLDAEEDSHADSARDRLQRAAAKSLRELAVDCKALMDTRQWDRETATSHDVEPPDVETTTALLEELGQADADTGQFDREQLRAAVAWFHSTRNFVVFDKRDAAATDSYQHYILGLNTSFATARIHQLIDAAEVDAQITLEDLRWSLHTDWQLAEPESELDPERFVPPCQRTTRTR